MSSERSESDAPPGDSPKTIVVSFDDNGRPHDYTIMCGDWEFRCHKSILSKASKYFKAAIDAKVIEQDSERMPLRDEDDPTAVNRMLEFCYNSLYGWEVDMSELPPHLHVRVCILSGRYNVQGLQQYAEQNFIRSLVNASIDQLSAALSEAYAVLPGPAHQRCKDIAIDHVQSHGTLSHPGFPRLLSSQPYFAADLVRAQHAELKNLRDTMLSEKTYRCPCNYETFDATIPDDEEYCRVCYKYRKNMTHHTHMGQEWNTKWLESIQ